MLTQKPAEHQGQEEAVRKAMPVLLNLLSSGLIRQSSSSAEVAAV
jgi:hypothetical protein